MTMMFLIYEESLVFFFISVEATGTGTQESGSKSFFSGNSYFLHTHTTATLLLALYISSMVSGQFSLSP
jgi:hypothetical protein